MSKEWNIQLFLCTTKWVDSILSTRDMLKVHLPLAMKLLFLESPNIMTSLRRTPFHCLRRTHLEHLICFGTFIYLCIVSQMLICKFTIQTRCAKSSPPRHVEVTRWTCSFRQRDELNLFAHIIMFKFQSLIAFH